MLPRMLRPCVLLLSKEQMSPTPKPSKKPRSPKPVPSRSLKPLVLWLSGTPRGRGPPRLNYPEATWQSHVRPGGASHLTGKQLPKLLPLCLPGHLLHQPSRAQRCVGGFLPGFVGVGPCIPLIHIVTKDLPDEGTACSSSSSCICAQAVSQAQKAASFPRSCGQKGSRWNHTQDSSRRAP